MQYRCSSRSVIFAENNNETRAAYTLSLTRWLQATDAVCWRKKSTYAHEGILHRSTKAHLPCFISSRGKKSRQILFEQATYSEIKCVKLLHTIKIPAIHFRLVHLPHNTASHTLDTNLLHLPTVHITPNFI